MNLEQYKLVLPDPEHPDRPCSHCPTEVRNLAATAANLLHRLDAIRAGQGDWAKVWSKAEDLRAALALLEPIREAHFADRRHSHGEEQP